jgi:hypothetical protein
MQRYRQRKRLKYIAQREIKRQRNIRRRKKVIYWQRRTERVREKEEDIGLKREREREREREFVGCVYNYYTFVLMTPSDAFQIFSIHIFSSRTFTIKLSRPVTNTVV